ncbi:MAG: hypothetical protein JSU91_08785, partial [Thermoplasmatales archaeon]
VAGASWEDKLAWWESDLDKQPSKPEKPIGPTTGKPGVEYTFETVSTDPNGEKLYFNWSWGNDNYSDWLGPYNSGEKCFASNIWLEKDCFEIKVKAKNLNGAESGWSDSLTFSTPKNKVINISFLILIEDNPFFFQLLNQLIIIIRNKISF